MGWLALVLVDALDVVGVCVCVVSVCCAVEGA